MKEPADIEAPAAAPARSALSKVQREALNYWETHPTLEVYRFTDASGVKQYAGFRNPDGRGDRSLQCHTVDALEREGAITCVLDDPYLRVYRLARGDH